MGQWEENVEDVRFVLSRIEWFATQPVETVRAHFRTHKMDGLCTVPHPSGKGTGFICGREAYLRINALGERFLACHRDKAAKVRLQEYTQELRAELVRRFIKESEPVERKNVDRMLSTAYRRISHRFEGLVHYIPCSVFLARRPAEFEVGPVRFMLRSKFEDAYGAEIEARREALASEMLEDARAMAEQSPTAAIDVSPAHYERLADSITSRMTGFFQRFDWVAIVEIPECDERTSERRALLAVEAALDMLKLLIGQSHTYKLGTAYGPRPNADSATLSRSPDGDLRISVSMGYQGNVIDNDWLSIILEQGRFYFETGVQTIGAIVDPNTATYLKLRFLDALRWYGEGVCENSLGAQVIKFVTAIEAMTVTGKERNERGEERGVTEIVTNRTTALSWHPCWKTRGKRVNEIGAVYDCRSRLVHGTMSPNDESLEEMAWKAEEIAQSALLDGLDFFEGLGLNDKAFGLKDLRKAYCGLEESCVRE